MTSPSPDPLNALLDEADWLRRVARALVHDAHAADDLTQDVLTDALTAPRPDSRPRLRGWLRVLARRHARRTRERRRSAAYAETRSAEPEVAAHEHASRRIALHRDLARAIDTLPAGDRQILVARYLEGRTAASIARETGQTPAAVRKRLSRSLARLRSALQEDDDRWGEWLGVVGCIPPASVKLAAVSRATPATFLGPAQSLLPLLTMKSLTAIASGIAIGILLFLSLTPSSSTERSLSGAVASEGRDPLVDPETPRNSPALEDLAEVERPLRRGAMSADGGFHVVGPDGETLRNAKGAWFDESGGVALLEFDGTGVAARPTRDAGELIVTCSGYRGQRIEVPACPERAEGKAVVVEFERQPESHFDVRVTRGRRRLAIDVGYLGHFEDHRGDRRKHFTPGVLEHLGIMRRSGLRVDPAGIVPFNPPFPEATYRIFIRGHAIVRAEGILEMDGDSYEASGVRLSGRAEGRDLGTIVIEAVATASGRAVWTGSELPFEGELFVTLSDEQRRSFSSGATLGVDSGEYTVALENFLPGKIAERERAARIWLEFSERGSEYRHATQLDVTPEIVETGRLPEIRLPEKKRLRVRAQSGLAEPNFPFNAVVASGASVARTDRDGLVQLVPSFTGELAALAEGHSIATAVAVPDTEPTEDVVVVRLNPTPDLVVRLKPEASSEVETIRIRCDRGLFQGRAAYALDRTTVFNLYDQLGLRCTTLDLDDEERAVSLEIRKGASSTVTIPALSAEHVLSVELLDDEGGVLEDREMVLAVDRVFDGH